VDNALPRAELAAMQAHLDTCDACARHDTVIRRGLLVLRNLPTVEPSPDFFDRLSRKLSHLEQADARAAVYRGPGIGTFLVAAASVLGVGFLAAALFSWTQPARNLSLDPVVAMEPAVPPTPVVSSGFVATASVGMPIWPAAMMAEQVPVHFASEEIDRVR
jgi:hypothetical protein